MTWVNALHHLCESDCKGTNIYRYDKIKSRRAEIFPHDGFCVSL